MGISGLGDRYSVEFGEVFPYGYIYVGMSVDARGRGPFVRRSEERERVISACKVVAGELEALDEVVRATVFRSVMIPPIKNMPRFDVVLLVETTSPEDMEKVRASETFERFDSDFVMSARNTRRIGDTEKDMSGIFLFNHFTAGDTEAAVGAWESVAGWYTEEIGVDNSTLLQPVGEAPYAFINYVRLPGGAVRFLLGQLARPSFHTFVRARLRENGMEAFPLMCEVVR